MSDIRCDVTTDEHEHQLERHGFSAFPAAFYRGDLVSNTVIWHWHDELELIMIHRGTIAAGAGRTSVTLTAGEGCFIKAGALHNIWKVDDNPCEYRSVVFHPRLIGSVDSIFWLNCVQPLGEPGFAQMIPFLSGDNHDFPAFFSRLWQVQEERNAGYENDIRYLLTKFAAQLSNTPAEKERRLQRAAGMLRNTEQSISEIAASCGFWDMSYFTKVFRQLYGLTPTAYRGGNQR